jgi:hypothetical protein
MTKYVRKPPHMWYKLVINLESRFITLTYRLQYFTQTGQSLDPKKPNTVHVSFPPINWKRAWMSLVYRWVRTGALRKLVWPSGNNASLSINHRTFSSKFHAFNEMLPWLQILNSRTLFSCKICFKLFCISPLLIARRFEQQFLQTIDFSRLFVKYTIVNE